MSTVKQKALIRHIGSYGDVQPGETFEAPGEEAKHNEANNLAKTVGGSAKVAADRDDDPPPADDKKQGAAAGRSGASTTTSGKRA